MEPTVTAIPYELLLEANREHFTRGRVRPNDWNVRRVPILWQGTVVGFYTPHRAANGRMRVGPIYVRPEYRGRGLALGVYRSIEGPMMACVEDGNVAAERLHLRAGFVRWRRYAHGWYWIRD
ncbi:MAG TPA: GNAT family N-acetyltransferase [Longimicrobiales bacterium]